MHIYEEQLDSFYRNDHKWTLVTLHNLTPVPVNPVGKDDACLRVLQWQRATLCAWEIHWSINADSYEELIKIKYERPKKKKMPYTIKTRVNS